MVISPSFQDPYFAVLLISLLFWACAEEPPRKEIDLPEATEEVQEPMGILVGEIDQDSIPSFIETRGILVAALEEKMGDGTSLTQKQLYIGIVDEQRWYLEARGDRDEHPALVALELKIDGEKQLYAPLDAKIYSCVAVEFGLCYFKTKNGEILACSCVDVDTTSTCELTVFEDIQLL